MADDIKGWMISSVFNGRGSAGDQEYVSHCKIYEDAGPGPARGVDEAGRKARYIILSMTRQGTGKIHKSKRNDDGTFSIGKTWGLEELRCLEVYGAGGFNISFSRMYRWQTEDRDEQKAFLYATVRLFRRTTGGREPELIGFRVPDPSAGRSSAADDERDRRQSDRSATPPMPNSGGSGGSSGRRPAQLSTSTAGAETPPRTSSPNMSIPQQSGGMRSGSPNRRGMLFTPARTSFDQSPSGSTPNGRPSLDLPRGGRVGPTPTPAVSPMTPGLPRGTPLNGRLSPQPRTSSPQQNQGSQYSTRGPSPTQFGSSPRRRNPPPELERRSMDRERPSLDERRPNGIPQTPRRVAESRSERAPSPPPNWDIPPQSSRPLPSARSERGPSPVFDREPIPTPSRSTRPRGYSRSERAPSPNVLVEPPSAGPSRRGRDREGGQSSGPSTREPSRARASPAPVPSPMEPVPNRDRDRQPIPPLPPSNTSLQPKPIAPLQPKKTSPAPSPITPLRSQPPPNRSQTDQQQPKKDPHARISYFDPTNQVLADRLLAMDGKGVDEESNEATMANVEEMLEGYEWTGLGYGTSDITRGAADQIEARLLKELSALDAANMFSFVTSDDRVTTVMKYIDDAVKELEEMDSLVQSYKIHMNAVSEDILFIQSQNRGLQVQTQNQKALLKELENLMQTVHVNDDALVALSKESLEKTNGIQNLEMAATELYKALQAGRDNDMAATMGRLGDYRNHNNSFCKRLVDFLPIMMSYQAGKIREDKEKAAKDKKSRFTMASHQSLENYLLRYSGLTRYLKEMDENQYAKLCAAYFSATSDLYKEQVKALLMAYINIVRKSEEDTDGSFGPQPPSAGLSSLSRGVTMRRAGTIVKSPMEGRNKDKDKDKDKEGDIRGYEAFGKILDEITPFIKREEQFLSDWLQVRETVEGETFADYMGLDSYFRRQATRAASGLSQGTLKLIRGAMDLVFGFLPTELKQWVDVVLSKDSLQMVGIIAHLERYMNEAEEGGNLFWQKQLQKLHQKLLISHGRLVEDQIKAIEQTKMSTKKRRGVVHFIKYFPVFVGRIESQLVGADYYEIRGLVDAAYDKIVTSMLESLQQMAKLESGDGEDKGQLQYHAILVENMHSFISDMGQLSLGSVSSFTRRAETIYDENVAAYVKLILRRFFSKLIDYLEGAEKFLQTSSPSDLVKDSNYNKAALKKLLKEYSNKDVRRYIDTIYTKRVEKHFTEDETGTSSTASSVAVQGTATYVVWKACEDEMVSIVQRFKRLMEKSYSGEMSLMDFGVTDVEAAFKKHRA